MATYESAWPALEAMAAEKAETDDTFDELFVIFTERVCKELVKPYIWYSGNEDGRKNWVEYHIWKFAFQRFAEFDFPGETTLAENMVKRGATMKEPHIVDVYEEMKDRRRALTVLWEEHAGKQRDRIKATRWFLKDRGPYHFAVQMERHNPDSKIWQQKLAEEAEGRRVAKFFTTLINGRHPYHVEIEQNGNPRLLQFALNGKGDEAEDVGDELDVRISTTWWNLDDKLLPRPPELWTMIVWVTIPNPIDFKDVARNPESYRRWLETAHGLLKFWKLCLELHYSCGWHLTTLLRAYEYYGQELKLHPENLDDQILQFWKWCVELDHDRGIALTTLPEAIVIFKKKDSKFKNLWLKDRILPEEVDEEESMQERICFSRLCSNMYSNFIPIFEGWRGSKCFHGTLQFCWLLWSF